MFFNIRRCNLLTFVVACIAVTPHAHADFLDEGRRAFMDYDFEKASELYAKYAQSLKKKPNREGEDLLDLYSRQLEIAENSLENVQKIEVIDRIDVPAGDYFKTVKLPSGGGRLLSPDRADGRLAGNESDFVFSNESGDFEMWSETDADGVSHLMESHRLTDGSWETPLASSAALNEGGDVRNPFMLTDGVTVYFSGDGDGSMGGYDLFVVSKDPATGEYRQPIGVGYPFNSPFNEYLMAVDEANGIGWWVTDRNGLDGKVSVYVFLTKDVRENYAADEVDDIVALARLDDISVARTPGTDYAAILAEIDKRSRVADKDAASEFCFPMPGGKVYRKLSDFSSPKAINSFKVYQGAKEEQEQELAKLRALRLKYHDADRKSGVSVSLANQIKDLERQTELQRDRLKKMRNTVITAELNQRNRNR